MIDTEKLDRDLAKCNQLLNDFTSVMDEMLRDLGGRANGKQTKIMSTKSSMRSDTKFRVSEDVMAVLKRSRIEGNALYLPDLFDNRPLYNDVMKVVGGAGGRWNKKSKAHVFETDPRPKLGIVLESGMAVNEKKKWQAFYTPPDLAEEIASMADVSGHLVLEPSAGGGALADACMKAGAFQVRCIEMNPEAAVKLEAKGYIPVCSEDFLTQQPASPYKRIVMNPPFTKNQDIKHIAHALTWLAEGGLLVSVMLGNTKRPKLKEMLNGRDWKIKDVPAGAFKQSGTNISTAILVVKG